MILGGDIGVRLTHEAWADEEWDESATAGAAYALTAASGARNDASSEEEEEETAAAVAELDDEDSEKGLNGPGPASAESSPKVSSAEEAEDKEEDDYGETSGS